MSWEAEALEQDMKLLRDELFKKLEEMEKRIIEEIKEQKAVSK